MRALQLGACEQMINIRFLSIADKMFKMKWKELAEYTELMTIN